ncbi:uncharacterized protein METZ01_LOCUS470933, partial [marine metagenome]
MAVTARCWLANCVIQSAITEEKSFAPTIFQKTRLLASRRRGQADVAAPPNLLVQGPSHAI